MLFEKQYILTENVVVETRYRTETRTGSYTVTDPETGETSIEEYEYEVQVPYDYYICTVTLENFNLSHVPVYIMGEEQLGMYATYMATLGNRPDLFPGSEYIGKYAEGSYTDYEIPRKLWKMKCSPPSSRKRRNTLAIPMSGAAARPLLLTVRALSVGSSIIPAGMLADWAHRDFATSVPAYPLPMCNR